MSSPSWEDAVRELLADFEEARAALKAALDAEKTVRATCKCGFKFDVPVKDHTNAVRAAEIWFRQGAELTKHLERLQEQAPVEDDRPYSEWPSHQLAAKLRKHDPSWPGLPDEPKGKPDKPA